MRNRREPRKGQGGDDAHDRGEIKWVGGTHSVEETLRARPQSVRELWIEHENNSGPLKAIIRAAREANIKIQFMARKELDRVAGRHQGVAAKVFFAPGETLIDWLNLLSPEAKKGLVVVALDEIQDPHNLGAIARSAVNLGATALIIPERRASPITPTAVAASAGAIQKIKVFKVVNMAQALERLKEGGFWLYGADAQGKAVWDVAVNLPMVLVIGSEGYGIRPIVRSACDELISIPQAASGVESLNASCAASVLLYEISRQKRVAAA